MSDERRQSRDLTRGDLLLLIARLRGELYSVAYSPVPLDLYAFDQSVLNDSSFDLSDEDEDCYREAKDALNRRLAEG